ncbi:hypothetical protein T440DRAFT_470751 [Plenodomus tracheiphilus IPT5]|uniref:Uncharacterized protein n=1 Tax=Plenodomus tracheiphilus IPT5 TaxID=1408161 RepID=A0A6A7AWM1_9PLEO|nr:hypothetical protein T440DRAFT_470751 [Plenodomus tracheiphilus IPT5]
MNTSVLAGVLDTHSSSNAPNDAQSLEYAHGATRSKLLTVLSTQMAYDAANNAETYALYALVTDGINIKDQILTWLSNCLGL